MFTMIKKATTKYTSMSDVAKATFWFFICNILSKCVNLITTPIFTRLLPPEEYGIFNIYISWSQLLVIFVTFRLDFGVFNKGMAKYSENKNEYTATMQTISSVLTLVAFFLYCIFHKAVNAFTGLTFFLTLALFIEVFFTNAISFWLIRQRYDFKYKFVVGITLAMTFANAILGVVGVIVTNYTALGRILSAVLIHIGFGLFIYISNYSKSKKLFVAEYAKFAILFNIPLLPHYFSAYIMDQFDRIMIQKIVGYSAVAIYSIAYSSGFIIKIITNSLNNTLIPWLYRKLKENDFASIAECFRPLIHCVLICFMAYTALAPEIIRILGSEAYYEAVYVMPPVVASVFLIFLYELFANIEFYYNANKFTMFIAVAGAILNVILNYIFINKWGYIMAAYTTLFSYCFFTAGHYIYMRYVLKKNNCSQIFNVTDVLANVAVINIYSLAIMLTFDYLLIRCAVILVLAIYVLLRRKYLFSFLHKLK